MKDDDGYHELYNEIFLQNLGKRNLKGDYFSWGRDARHTTDDSEDKKFNNKSLFAKRIILDAVRSFKYRWFKTFKLLGKSSFKVPKKYDGFSFSFEQMGDLRSKVQFCELILLKVFGESKISNSAFSDEFISSYENCSAACLASPNSIGVYKWVLRRVRIPSLDIDLYTVPTTLNLVASNRLYEYHSGDTTISVRPGDVVIDAGVGWGDTTMVLAKRCLPNGGRLFAFDILDDAFSALDQQLKVNPHVTNLVKVKKALFETDDNVMFTSDPSPGARIVKHRTNHEVQTITLDKFVSLEGLDRVDFIKMDIEGAELFALRGSVSTIERFKPRMAISAYHLWDDLKTIVEFVFSIRDDYRVFLDCTTGFGGEAILYFE